MKCEEILYEDGGFRLCRISDDQSYIAHKCQEYPEQARNVWWYLPAPQTCYMCGMVPPEGIRGLYLLHNWDRIQATK